MNSLRDISGRLREILKFARDNDNEISLFVVRDIIKNKTEEVDEELLNRALDQLRKKEIKILPIDMDEGYKNDVDEPDYFIPSDVNITQVPTNISNIMERLENEEYDLTPAFQRHGGLWSREKQSQLIESFMVQLPIPPMYFDGKKEDSWLVIDGLQRLCTLKEFVLDQKFVLCDLEYMMDYNGCTFNDLPRIYQRRIEEAQVAFYLVLPGTPPDVKYSLFKRINTPGLRLEPQEIRHALYQGKATKFLQELAESELFGKATDGDVPSERMQDREMVLRYFALRYIGEETYKEHTLDGYLCKAMEFLNDQKSDFLEENRILFLDTLECCYSIFGKQAFRRISKSKPYDKKPINSALFEAWMNGISRLTVKQRQLLTTRKEKLRELYMEELDKRSTFNADIGSGKYRSFVRRNSTIKEMIEEVLM